MDRNSLNEKSLELIRKTKEFLQLKKTYDDIQSVFLLIKQAKDEAESPGRVNIDQLPERVVALIRTAGDIDLAENLALGRMKELKDKMAMLSVQIRKISEEIEPHLTKTAEPRAAAPKNSDSENVD